MHDEKFKNAKEYARLIRIKGNKVDICRVRLFDGHMHNWYHLIHSDGILYSPTDQTFDLGANYSSDVHYWDELWVDGVRVYKKPLWRKILFWKHMN